MEIANLSLAFSAGLLAVLAPCSLPMLPSFVSYFLNSEGKKRSLESAISFGLTTVAGFLTIFLAIGLLPSFALNILSNRINLVTPFIGVILIVLGLGHLFTDVFSNIPVIKTADPKGTGYKVFYLYGLGYGAASMACSFPVFVLLVLQSVTAGGFASILSMFLAYGLGAASILVPLSVALTYGREFFYLRLLAVLPYVKKINAVILIFAGAYMIYYGLG
jgi:cytochrome c-type biogenesis protein